MAEDDKEIEELKKKLKELEDKKQNKGDQDRKNLREGLGMLEGSLADERQELSKNVGTRVPTTIVSLTLAKLGNNSVDLNAPGARGPEEVPLVKEKGFALHRRDSEKATETLAKFGLNKDSFQYENLGQKGELHRHVLTKTEKWGSMTATTTVVGVASTARSGQAPDFVNVTVTDPAKKTSYSHSVGTVFIDKDRGSQASADELKAAEERVKKLLPKGALESSRAFPAALKEMLKRGEGRASGH